MSRVDFVSGIDAEKGSVIAGLIEGFWREQEKQLAGAANKQWAYWLLILHATKEGLTNTQIMMANAVGGLSRDQIASIKGSVKTQKGVQ